MISFFLGDSNNSNLPPIPSPFLCQTREIDTEISNSW